MPVAIAQNGVQVRRNSGEQVRTLQLQVWHCFGFLARCAHFSGHFIDCVQMLICRHSAESSFKKLADQTRDSPLVARQRTQQQNQR